MLTPPSSVVDPDPDWECGSKSKSIEIYQNLKNNLVSCVSKTFLRIRMNVFDILHALFLKVEIQFLCL
jgi:hypothetical protein